MVFQMNYIPQVFVLLISQAFALDQGFAAPEFHKQFVIVTLQPLKFTNNL